MKKFLTLMMCVAVLCCFGCKKDDDDNIDATTIQITSLEKEGKKIYGYTTGLSYDSTSSAYVGTGYSVVFVPESDESWEIYLIFEYKDGEKQGATLGYEPAETKYVTPKSADNKVTFSTDSFNVSINAVGGTIATDKYYKLVCNSVEYSAE